MDWFGIKDCVIILTGIVLAIPVSIAFIGVIKELVEWNERDREKIELLRKIAGD